MNELVNEQPMDDTRDDVVVSDTLQDITQEMTSTQEPLVVGGLLGHL